jgi:hypothetical protein
MNDQAETDDSKFEKDVRVDLTLDLLERADKAGETIRALLFAGIGAGLALLLYEPTPSPGFFHVLAVLVMLGAGGSVIYSWHIQKKKAIKRFKAVLKNGVTGYVAVQRNWNQNKWKSMAIRWRSSESLS